MLTLILIGAAIVLAVMALADVANRGGVWAAAGVLCIGLSLLLGRYGAG